MIATFAAWFLAAMGLIFLVATLWPRKKRRYIRHGGIDVETDDPMAAEVIAKAFLTGKAQYFSRDEDGNITRKEIDQ